MDFHVLGKIRDKAFDLLPDRIKIKQLEHALSDVRDRKEYAEVLLNHYTTREKEILNKMKEIRKKKGGTDYFRP